MRKYDKLIFELSQPGRRAFKLPELDIDDVEIKEIIPEEFLNDKELELPELSEVDIIRHYTNLSNKNYGVDTGFYPLGSCTMKYNPKINEDMAGLDGFKNIHPHQPEKTVQGALQMMYELDKALCEISGMDKMTLQPAAGAHGELTGLTLIKAYHENRGDTKRTKIIVPDSAHGTNPASAMMAGFETIEIKSTEEGLIDIDSLKSVLNDEIAGLMLTNPNTLGLFERDIVKIAELVHEAGGLLYYDGANANAILGKVRPGDMGFDVVHFNLHKTFSTPHGGGGPGSGPVGVKKILMDFLPTPTVEKDNDRYYLNYNIPHSVGRIKDFYGHFSIMVRAYTYILSMGKDGLEKVSEMAVLNANYLANKLKDYYNIPDNTIFKHEFVMAGLKSEIAEATTLDIAKRLLDFGYHPPTIYFPLIVHEALMTEPTETESKETLDEFAQSMINIAKEAKENPQILKEAPHSTPVRRLDETRAARKPILKYEG